jgi:prefoldin subunit 5
MSKEKLEELHSYLQSLEAELQSLEAELNLTTAGQLELGRLMMEDTNNHYVDSVIKKLIKTYVSQEEKLSATINLLKENIATVKESIHSGRKLAELTQTAQELDVRLVELKEAEQDLRETNADLRLDIDTVAANIEYMGRIFDDEGYNGGPE